jgi:hypothetical protein
MMSYKLHLCNRLSIGKVLFFEFWPTVLLDLDKTGETQDMILNGISA